MGALLGSACYAISLYFFWWAVSANASRPLSCMYSTDAPQHLLTSGPYVHVRHPFYSSYMLAWMAASFATGSCLLWISALVMFWFYHGAACIEEDKFARSDLANEYAAYRETTGMFFPKLAL